MIDRLAMLERWRAREGDAYTDRPTDRGGPTKFGLTLALLRAYRGQPDVPAAVLEGMSWEDAREVIWDVFAVRAGLTRIENPLLFEVVWDAAGNHGQDRAIRMLQRALRVTEDGKIGPVTVAALPYLNAAKLALLFQAQRYRFFALIASRDRTDNDRDGIPDALENLPGWINRCTEITERIAGAL